MNIHDRVRKANKLIYDKLADNYEIVDGRRSKDLYIWIRERLSEIAQMAGGRESLLDIGCGTGFVAKAAKGVFSKIYGVDISENILKSLYAYGISPINADAESLPFKEASVDAVVLFSVIHHFYDYKPVLHEVYRVLKPEGVVYIDHDMSKDFFKNFKFFINIYRRLSHKEHMLKRMGVKELYDLSEIHSRGIDSEGVRDYLISLGFRIVNNYYHWYGLSKITDIMFRKRTFPKGMAPLSMFIAQKL